MGGIKTVVWFRRDLRIEDNPALAAAARDGSVFPVYIWCPKGEGQFYPSRVSRWWLKQSLAHLERSLKSLGAELMLIRTDSTLASLFECIKAVGATKVVFNHLYGIFWFLSSKQLDSTDINFNRLNKFSEHINYDLIRC
ncbi:hypothetical protein I3843_06G139800 [Carya illinoinensis]|uniref:Photolyase/cryptochrome alpha/beta domain-containing protein n=1 Tax=Carya illinoinensis TaxID=32201 RepID=A0A922EW20_CARIL|nr:hypothetical protein I3842_06G147300 [Carya illinoinensis]KAG7976242.1 hypothetical protein I3843_06G139800 [Carya illinoinensis]